MQKNLPKQNLLPLYKKAVENKPNKSQKSHLGLWYDKFCDEWRIEDGYWTLDKNKQKWISMVATRVGEKKQIEDTVKRLKKIVDYLCGQPIVMKTTGRFVTGLGRANPVENGFAWHPTLGTPYLPGSSVKGLVRAWAKEKKAKKELIERLLGPEEDQKKQVGEWIFFDALPTDCIKLEMDIMTPHYGPYYADPENNPPKDSYDPIPIPFLTVAPEQSFLFAIAPRRKLPESSNEGEKQLCDRKRLMKWLEESLEWYGAGAKTAVGYGRFQVDEKAMREIEEQQKAEADRKKLEKLSPLERELVEDGYPEDCFIQHTSAWIDRMKKAELMEKIEIATKLKAWYDKAEFPFNQKNKKKIKEINEVLQQHQGGAS
jgi:CRISPR-associated protein Cmr6